MNDSTPMTVADLIAYLQGLCSPDTPVYLYVDTDRTPLTLSHMDDSFVKDIDGHDYLDINVPVS